MTPYRLPHRQAAEYIGISADTLDKLVVAGRLVPCREKLGKGNRRMYLRRDLEKYCEKSKETLY